ncbi:MAG: peptidoglycan-binding protein LysM [Lachnospiraceae bacterium]|nr:peptidoglycan-binding protein LysM [Desulfovibrio sp.]MBR4606621.1 peptidoglycan-binding protein LysM [Lachnospiraceae bacterium]
MGLISFMKDVGDKIFGSGKANAAELKKDLDSLGLETQELEVEVEGDQVVLKGTAKDQETLEKAILQVGNKAGIASVKTDDVTVKTPGADSGYYEVKKGDTLWKIAESQYGKGKGAKYTVIFNANKPMLKDPDKIYPGQKLRIPPLD